MNQLTMCENVPRKEKQFRNFTNNSLRLKGADGERIKGEIWALLSKVRDEEKKIKEEDEKKRKEQQEKQSNQNPKTEKDGASKKKTKSVSESSDDESVKASAATIDLPSKKDATKAIKKALKKAPSKQLKFKALRKQMQSVFKADKSGKKKLKKLLQECLDDNPKKLAVDGKIVMLVK